MDIQLFNYGSNAVRTIEQNGEAWFVAKDVCDVLELSNPTEALRALDDDEKNTLRISEGIRGNPTMNVINESGLYRLALMKIFSKQGFVISDPCYVLSEDVYFNFWGKKKKFADGIFEVNGFSFTVSSTAHGDGVHYDNACHKYSVDSGAIGLIPLELLSKKEGLGAVFELPGEAEFYCEDGIFDIFLPDGKNIYINTRHEENDS